jgi:uncharacterized protein
MVERVIAVDITETKAARLRFGQKALRIVMTLLALALCAIALSATLTKLPGEEQTPVGMKRNTALYLGMRDGIQIAADIWMPADLRRGEKLPVITGMSRYWRATEVGWPQRAAYGLGLTDMSVPAGIDHFNKKRFIYIDIDARGTGASGGNRRSEWDPEEIKDYAEIIRWASRQPWSNGRIGAIGASYSGNTAELVASTGEPALKAVAPGYDDFDPLLFAAMPGGAFNTGFVAAWSDANKALDANDICTLAEATGIMCGLTKLWTSGVKRVDADKDGTILADIMKKRRSATTLDIMAGLVYRDDIGKKAGGINIADVSPYSPARRALVEKYKVPMLIFAGWMDAASGEGALRRFATFNSPQEVYLGMFSHGGGFDTDPLAPLNGPLGMSGEKQLDILTAFFEKHLRSEPAQPMTGKTLHYFTGGARTWNTTSIWPIKDTLSKTLYFGDRNTLVDTAVTTDETDVYKVDFASEIGKETRYHTPAGGADVRYPNRRKQGEKLLTYDSAPLVTPLTITGTPVLTISLASTHDDGVVIAYLETVAPNGDVKYITEGLLRVIHRKETTEPTPYAEFGVSRSYLRKDGAPLAPGQMTTMRIALFATSITIPEGYRIRVSLAGASKGLFDRYPAKGNPTWTISRSAEQPSFLTLPVISNQ